MPTNHRIVNERVDEVAPLRSPGCKHERAQAEQPGDRARSAGPQQPDARAESGDVVDQSDDRDDDDAGGRGRPERAEPDTAGSDDARRRGRG